MQDHIGMVDSCLSIDFAFRLETKSLVERDSMCLRGEADGLERSLFCGCNERSHDCQADAAVTVGLEDGDSTDVAIAKEPPCRNRFVVVEGQRMEAIRVQSVDFQFARYALFFYEDFEPNGENRVGVGFEFRGFDANHSSESSCL